MVKQFESLSTSYINLAGLLRFLRQQNFVGTVKVQVEMYEAEVELRGAEPPLVSEIDSNSGRATSTPGALERLMVHAREPGGTIIVLDHQAADDAEPPQTKGESIMSPVFAEDQDATADEPEIAQVDWSDLLDAGGKVIGAVERALGTAGADFESSFRDARIQLGDDYPFIDPTGNGFSYANKRIELRESTSPGAFVTAVSECLHRVVNKIATGQDSIRLRETVAIELAVAARIRPNGLSEFTGHLDRIAGTRVL
ncbi:MAG TPA: hypothetical protein VGN86_11865 [Pyrinomonadaceae bacterium]|nr:hypothetical protein [Pyrinomonadaceae bacterium]